MPEVTEENKNISLKERGHYSSRNTLAGFKRVVL